MSQSKSAPLFMNRFELVKETTTNKYFKIMELYDHSRNDYSLLKITKNPKTCPYSLSKEVKYLSKLEGYPGIPEVVWSGKVEDGAEASVMSLLGESLSSRLKACNNKFTIKTSCMLALDLLKMIKNLHSKGLLHRKICIDSFVFGRGKKCNQIYFKELITCSKTSFQSSNFDNIQPNMFSPAAAYNKAPFHFKQDVQSLFYLVIYFLKGTLPWEQSYKNFKAPPFNKVNKNGRFDNTSLLCKGLPKCFSEIINNIRCLREGEEPNYYFYEAKIKSLMYQLNEQIDNIYDWMLNRSYMQKFTPRTAALSISLDQDEKFIDEFEKQYGQIIEYDGAYRNQFINNQMNEQKVRQSIFEQTFSKFMKKNNRQSENSKQIKSQKSAKSGKSARSGKSAKSIKSPMTPKLKRVSSLNFSHKPDRSPKKKQKVHQKQQCAIM